MKSDGLAPVDLDIDHGASNDSSIGSEAKRPEGAASGWRPAIIDDARHRAKRRRIGIAVLILAVALITGAALLFGGPGSPREPSGGVAVSDRLADRRAELQTLAGVAPRPLLLRQCTARGMAERIRVALRDHVEILDSLPPRVVNGERIDISELLRHCQGAA
jgi:hypothetical protein